MADIGWGKHESDEKYGRPGDRRDDFILLSYEISTSERYATCKHAAHAMLFARDRRLLMDLYDTRAAILMQFRNDGLFGFPGGIVEEGETPVMAANREMEEEMALDLKKHSIQDKDHVVSYYNQKKNVVLHFYGLELTMDEFLEMERRNLQAVDYGIETMGLVRPPLYTMGDGYRGFPAFLTNGFSGNAREQLLAAVIHFKILTDVEVQEARKSIKDFHEKIYDNESHTYPKVSRGTSVGGLYSKSAKMFENKRDATEQDPSEAETISIREQAYRAKLGRLYDLYCKSRKKTMNEARSQIVSEYYERERCTTKHLTKSLSMGGEAAKSEL